MAQTYSKKFDTETTSLRTLQDVGKIIRELRLHKNMTGVELAKRTQMSQAKVSRLETGILRISAKEITTVLNILDCPSTIQQQVFAVLQLTSHTAASKYRPARSLPAGDSYRRESSSTYIRGFLYNMLPAILQTTAYRQALLKDWELSQREFAQLMTESEKRQELLWDTNHTFHFIVPETVLYTRSGNPQIQLSQLDRLDRISNLKQVKFGVIPVQAGVAAVEHSNFVLYDSRLVVIIYLAEEQISSDPVAIAEHRKAFDELHQKACYNVEAQELIQRAIDYFN